MVEDVFIIANKQLAATASGKFYIKAFCSDRTCQMTVRIWNATREMFAAMPDGGMLRIRGRVENYQNNLQLIIEQMWPAKAGTYDPADLMPHTERDVDQMFARITEICATLGNKHLKALVQAYLDDQELMKNFRRAPAAMNFHHAFVGGLLEHTLNAMEVADAVCKFYPKLNRDIVVAGVFLHDLAKTWELNYESAFSYSDGGQLVGHIVKGAMWVEKKAEEAEKSLGEPIPRPLIDVIQHIILSHHGEPEFGAARLPSTPEAIAVHVVENLDAKLMMALQLTRGENATESNWTEYQKAFNGRLYRPDTAPGDNAPAEPAPRHEAAEGTAAIKTPAPTQQTPESKDRPTETAQARETAQAHRNPAHSSPSQAAPRSGKPSDNPEPKVAATLGKLAINNPLFESSPARKH
ncbi:MAG TPA: HD domain-containing protein [Tepidisphaeraceae bacterium]